MVSKNIVDYFESKKIILKDVSTLFLRTYDA